MRGSTAIYIGDSAGNRTQNSFAGLYPNGSPTNETNQCTAVFLDSRLLRAALLIVFGAKL